MRRFVFLPLAGILASAAAALPAASAQTGHFIVALNGHNVGTARCSFVSTPKGHDVSSVVNVTVQGLDYALSKNERLTSANELRHVMLSAVINNEAVTVTAAPDSAQIVIDFSANGRSAATRLPAHSGAVFMPDFDPGALETLLTLAAERNNRGLWAIIPKKSGTQEGSIDPIQLATYADQQGTLDGKLIVVHHLVATIAGVSTDLFSGPNNRLLQAELPQQGFALVRKGFVLKPTAKAAAPPAQ
ncbi:MAG: hypothetical protein ACRD3N_03845 [Terracidiphilus sp.]